MGPDEQPPAQAEKIQVTVKSNWGNKTSGKGRQQGWQQGWKQGWKQGGWGQQQQMLVATAKHRSRSPAPKPHTSLSSSSLEVVMRVGETQAIQDALGRAINATEHAAQLSRSASKVFDDSTASLQVENAPLHYFLLPSTTSTTTTTTTTTITNFLIV